MKTKTKRRRQKYEEEEEKTKTKRRRRKDKDEGVDKDEFKDKDEDEDESITEPTAGDHLCCRLLGHWAPSHNLSLNNHYLFMFLSLFNQDN